MGLLSSPLSRTGFLALGVLFSVSCSTLSPQIFSDDMVTAESEGADPPTLAQARARASQASARYLGALREQSAVGPSIGAGLLGLTALALIHSLNHSSGNELATIGIAGSAAYLYGNTFISRERQSIYREGSKALLCAVSATDLFVGLEARATQWAALQTTMNADVAALSATVAKYAYLEHERTTTTAAGGRPAGCAQAERPSCDLQNASPGERAIHEGICAKARTEWDRRCTPSPARTRVDTPDPAVTAAFTSAREELAKAEALNEQLLDLSAKELDARRDLAKASREIQLAVSKEVQKTEPDLAAIVAATRGIGSGASALSPPVTKGPARLEGGSVGRVVTVRAVDAATQDALRELGTQTAALVASRGALARKAGPLLRSLVSQPPMAQACQFTSPLASPTAPAAPGAAAVPSADTSPSVTTDDLKRLGLRPDATQQQIVKAVIACQKLLQRPSPPTGDFDAGTRAAVREGTACQNVAASAGG